MKTWLLKNKELTFWITGISIVVFLWSYYLPKQDCLANISTYGDKYLYPYDEYDRYEENSVVKRFKTRNDALDYCMAQRWDFSNNSVPPIKESPVIFNDYLNPEPMSFEEARAKRLQEKQDR